MKLAVIIPVGPGHEQLAERAAESVRRAWQVTTGQFGSYVIRLVHDLDGTLGRSRARNLGMDDSPADWHFLLDADDEMCARTFGRLDRKVAATFGSVYFHKRTYHENVWPCTRETLLQRGARGTLSMGCFVKGDLGLRFDESLDVGEDFDFYMRLPSFTKLNEPLVSIGYDQPSAGGPRGYVKVDWLQAADAIIDRYREVSV